MYSAQTKVEKVIEKQRGGIRRMYKRLKRNRRIMRQGVLFYLSFRLVADGYTDVPIISRLNFNITQADNVKDKGNSAEKKHCAV